MSITIELPEDLSARLAAAGIPADDAARYALAALAEVADHAEVRAWWDGLSRHARTAEIRKTRESLAAADAGRTSPAEDVLARVGGRGG